MNRFLFSLLIIFNTNTLAAQTGDSLMNDIESKARLINDQLSSCDTVYISSWEESIEGVTVTGYINRRDIKLIHIIWFGAIGKKEMFYYFYQGKLVFASQKDYVYNRPINWDKEKSIANGDSDFYDPIKTTTSQKYYYFVKEKLYKSIDDNQIEMDMTLDMNKLAGKGLITDAYKWKRELFK